jgi:nucleoside-diphosphate-sugar epimerase
MMLTHDQKVLVTGAGGFIGGHLVKRLKAQGHTNLRAVDIKPLNQWFQCDPEVENLSLDLRLRRHCELAVRNVARVYNLASDMGGIGFIENNKARCMLSVLINTHLLDVAREAGCQRFFFASSACVYGVDKQKHPNVAGLREADAYPAMPEDGYGWEKLFTERMCRHYREDFGLATRIARYHNVYGPLGAFRGGREKAPAAIARKVAEAKISGRHEIEIWGDGRQTRSFMFIDDCIDGSIMLMESDFVDPINIGSSESVSINHLVDIVEEIAGVKLYRRYNLDAPKGVNGRNSDNSLILEQFNWEPSTPLVTGMESTYAWIYDQLASDRPLPQFR